MSKAQDIIKQIDDYGLTLQQKEWVAFLEEVVQMLFPRYEAAKENVRSTSGPADENDEEEDTKNKKGLTSTNQPIRKTKWTKKR